MDRIQTKLRSRPAWDSGRLQAEAEIAVSKLGYREYGKLDIVLVEEVAKVLRERHEIAITIVGACITDIDVAAEAEGYNERMIAEFNSRFGRNIVEAVYREVERKAEEGQAEEL